MPYIPKNRRKNYDENINELVEMLFKSTHGTPNMECNNGMFKGDLNYIIYAVSKRFMNRMMQEYGTFSYEQRSDLIAAMRDCAEEFRRKNLDTYEDDVIARNGDIE